MNDLSALPYRPAAGIMLINAAHHVWVGQRIDNAIDAWQMPQGGVDPGEDVQAAALRELEEETGVAPHLVEIIARAPHPLTYDLPADLQATVWQGRYRGQIQSWFLMRFLGSDADVQIKTAHPEFCAWKWVPPHSLPDIIVPFKRTLYEEVLRAFEGLLEG